MSYAPVMRATMYGLGAMPISARPIAEFLPTWRPMYDIEPAQVPVRASHFTVQRPSTDRIVVSFYSQALPSGGEQLLTRETFTQSATATPERAPSQPAKTGVLDTVKRLFEPKSGQPSAGKGAPTRRAPPAMPSLAPSPSTTPSWVMPVVVVGLLVVAAGGVVWASTRRAPRRRVAPNRRRRRRKRRR